MSCTCRRESGPERLDTLEIFGVNMFFVADLEADDDMEQMVNLQSLKAYLECRYDVKE